MRGSPNAVRLDRELLHLPVSNTLSNSLRSSLGRLAMQDLEDRPADRFFARHALQPGLALAIPRLNAVLAVDHVEADRQRIDDLLGEAALLVDLARARRHLGLEAVRVLGVAQRRREQVGDRRRERAGPRRTASRPGRADSAPSSWRPASSGATTTPSRGWSVRRGGAVLRRAAAGVSSPATAQARRSPSSPRSQRLACVPSSSLATAARMPGITAPTESPVASAAAISAIAVSVRGIGLRRARTSVEQAKRSLGHDVVAGSGRTDKMTDYSYDASRRVRNGSRFATAIWPPPDAPLARYATSPT